MEPSVSHAATVLEGYLWAFWADSAHISQLCTRDEAFCYPSCNHNSSFLPLPQALIPLSLSLVPCDKVVEKKGVAMATAPSPAVAELSLWRAHFLPMTDTKQGNVGTLTLNVELFKKSCSLHMIQCYYNSIVQGFVSHFHPASFFKGPYCSKITGKYGLFLSLHMQLW